MKHNTKGQINLTISSFIAILFLISCEQTDREGYIQNSPIQLGDSKQPIDSIGGETIANFIEYIFAFKSEYIVEDSLIERTELTYDFLNGKFKENSSEESIKRHYILRNDSNKIIIEFDHTKILFERFAGIDFEFYNFRPINPQHLNEYTTGILLNYGGKLLLFSFESRSGTSTRNLSSISELNSFTLQPERVLTIHHNELMFMFEGKQTENQNLCDSWADQLLEFNGEEDRRVSSIKMYQLLLLFNLPCNNNGENIQTVEMECSHDAPFWIYKGIPETTIDSLHLIWY